MEATSRPTEAGGEPVFSVDPAGNISFQIVGKITDLCSPLAA
jgi:hypothetical protein